MNYLNIILKNSDKGNIGKTTFGGLNMNKKYIVSLTDEERAELQQIIKENKGSMTYIRRARILLKSDVNGPAWTDKKIAEAYDCHIQGVVGVRRRFVENGLRRTLEGDPKQPRRKVLDGDQEAKIIALRLSNPPAGHTAWTLRLLAEKAVELHIVEKVSYQTIRTVLKKRE